MNMRITKRPSPNYNERRNAMEPYLIIIHYTGTKTAAQASPYYLNTVTDPAAGRISPHYMIESDGHITQFVEEDKRAWHAGKSCWQGEHDINSASIGIELVNEGEYANYPSFEGPQIAALQELCRDIMRRYNIATEGVIGHSDIAPERKKDPGPAFPWDAFRRALAL